MNGLATLLAPTGELPQVLGMAGQSPGSGQAEADSGGFLDILQQLMIGGSMQMAAALSVLPLQTAPVTEADGNMSAALLETGGDPMVIGAGGSANAEQPGVLSGPVQSSAGQSPPEQLEAVSLVPTPTVEQPVVVEEQTRSPGKQSQETTPQQGTAQASPVQTIGGAIALPVELLTEEAEMPGLTAELQAPAVPALPKEQDNPIVARENAPTVTTHTVQQLLTHQTGSRTSAKASQTFRVPSTRLQSDEPAVLHKSTGKISGDDGKPEGPVPLTGDESPAPVVRLARVVESDDQRTSAALVVGSEVPVGQSVKEESPTSAVVVSDDAPIAVKGEEIPAKAVVAAKPATEMQWRDDGTARSAFTHVQTQIGAVRPAATRLESISQHLPEYLTALPPETTRSVVDQIVTGAALQVHGESSSMRIKLVPASLGEVTLNVRMEGGQMQAQIDVSHASVKAALENSLPQLREALSSHGIEVQRLDVFHNGQSMARDAGGGQADRYPRNSTKHQQYAADAVEHLETGRMMGYNTIEVVM
jgi:flagellar hook-length control protein FliK